MPTSWQNAYAGVQRMSVYPDDLFLSFLPLSHTLERTVGYYIPMMAGACVAHVRSIDKLADDLVAVRPTVLISVPRIYERVHKKIWWVWTRNRPWCGSSSTWRSMWDGNGSSISRDAPAGRPLILLWPLLKKIVADRVTAGLGGRLRLAISGGAPLAPPIARVFIGLGLNLLQGYGLTETSPVVSVNTLEDNLPATVGRPLPGVEVKVADNGELLVRGPTVMLGYWRNSEATEAVIDRDGWFHTGDLARIDEGGHITITGRLKEIIVLSTGEKVPPEDLETRHRREPPVRAGAGGRGRAPLPGRAGGAQQGTVGQNWPHGSAWLPGIPAYLAGDRVEQALLAEIARRIARFPGYARIRRVHATLSPWGVQEGLITATLKLRRREAAGEVCPGSGGAVCGALT